MTPQQGYQGRRKIECKVWEEGGAFQVQGGGGRRSRPYKVGEEGGAVQDKKKIKVWEEGGAVQDRKRTSCEKGGGPHDSGDGRKTARCPGVGRREERCMLWGKGGGPLDSG